MTDGTEQDGAERAGEAAVSLVRLMDRLRADCPWDRKQTLQDLAGYLLEESHEVLEALAEGDLDALEGELGDLLFQIFFLAKLGEERRAFDLASISRRIEAKMIARHPHVFAEAQVRDAEGVRQQWESLKKKEREADGRPPSPFAGLPKTLPALLKAYRIGSRAADLGFDWARDEDVLAKLDEEVAEFEAEVKSGTKERAAEEIGDILFTVVNVARRLGVDPEAALQVANGRFVTRFEEVARRNTVAGREMKETPLEVLNRLWEEVKQGR